jgi:hypothetical protein
MINDIFAALLQNSAPQTTFENPGGCGASRKLLLLTGVYTNHPIMSAMAISQHLNSYRLLTYHLSWCCCR